MLFPKQTSYTSHLHTISAEDTCICVTYCGLLNIIAAALAIVSEVIKNMAQVAGAVLFAVLSAQCVHAQFDDIILQEVSNGSAVVLLTIARLQQSGIFADDNKLLRRIAYVETRDGTADNTYRQGYDGGIWAVDENIFNDTQNINIHPRLRAKFDQIRRQFNVDWCSVRWSDLRKPLYSAIAARLALYNFPRTIPKATDVSAQAQLWADYYRQGGSVSEFVTVASELQGMFEHLA